MSEKVDLGEFVSGFLVEADEHLRAASANLLLIDAAARKGEASPRPVRELFRSLHTIKGLAAMVGVEPIVDVAHAMEAVLRAADRAGGKLSAPVVEHLLSGTRAIEQRVKALAEGKPVQAAPAALVAALSAADPVDGRASTKASLAVALEPELYAKLNASEQEQLAGGIEKGMRAVRVDFIPSPARSAEGLTITAVRERVTPLAEIVKILPVSMPRTEASPGGLKFTLILLTTASEEAIAAAAATTPSALQTLGAAQAADAAPPIDDEAEDDETGGEALRRGVVRVGVERLDDAMEKLSALVVTRSRLDRAVADLAAKGVDVRAIRQITEEHSRQVRSLRAAILELRMVSVREMLEPVPLILRGLRAATGKAVRLEIDVGQAELDKAVAERILPAIVHLLRNAVDHGIEDPEARRRAGKPEEGLIRITCHERSNTQIDISVSDDGGGIDSAAVARRAGQEVPRSDAALLELLAIHGLSTRDSVTKTSGRGLGMHIVKRTAEELGGELLLRTSREGGTTFTLRVPLTVTIFDAFTFESGAQAFAAPVAMVEEIIEVDPDKVITGPQASAQGSRVSLIVRRGVAVPLFRLSHLFSLQDGAGGGRKALVVRRNGELFAFAVDRMVGRQEIVARPLEDPLVKVPGVPAVADLGDGKPTLILDLPALSARLTARREGAPS